MYLENFKKFLRYYGKNRKVGLTVFTVLSFFSGCLELIGVALVYPFVILIIDPTAITKTTTIHLPQLPQNSNIPLLLGGCVFLAFILKSTLMIIIQYVQSRFVSSWRLEIVNTFMNYFIYAPYNNTMKYSQADKLYLIESVISSVISDFVIRSLTLLTNVLIISMIIGLLLIKFPVPAIISLVIICASLLIQNKFFKKRTTEIASVITQKSKEYKSVLVQNIYNIKELKILSAESFFNTQFLKKALELNDIQILQGFYSSIPPYIIETLIIFGLLIMAVILSFQKSDDSLTLIASFGLIAAALFRIAPALNRIQSSIINIGISRNFVKILNEKYEEFGLENFTINAAKDFEKLPFNKKIGLEKVYFSYDNKKDVLKNISFEIEKGDFIGIIGLSGAGKSTIADIITGLLPVENGKLYLDDEQLTEKNFPKFRKIIGYVPQQINIIDKSYKENVAWGCKNIDEEKVIESLKTACLYDMVQKLPNGINEIVKGSNGLSQGQKQRLAIARALYRDPEVIILDEATSALDVQVEHEITEMLTKVSKKTTIIAIAHRLSTLKACNKLIYVKNGEIVDVGTFPTLSEKYPEFSNLVKLSSINLKQ